MFLQIFNIIFPVIAIALIGFFYARGQKISMETPNKMSLELFIPIMIFFYLSEKLPSIHDITTFSLGGVIVVFGSSVIIYPIIRLFGLNWRTFLPPMMFNNSINLGLPLALFAFGQEAMSLAISLSIVQIVGQFTVGVVLYGGVFSVLGLVRSPVILATVFGLGFNYFGIHLPSILLVALEMMANVAIPMVIIALGARLVHIELRYWKIGLLGAVLCPLSGIAMALVATAVFDYTDLQVALLILFGALPPAVLNAIMAERYNHDAVMVASVVAMGNLFSLVFIPLVLYFLL